MKTGEGIDMVCVFQSCKTSNSKEISCVSLKRL